MEAIDTVALPDEKGGYVQVALSGDGDGGVADRVHLLSAREINAVNAALAAGRPLLIRGEPGIGKSQLARAVAKVLGRAFIKHVVDSRTESRDLLWTFDAVKRLAEAQLVGAMGVPIEEARESLAVERFVRPGPLWWAFDWEDALRLCEKRADQAPSQPDAGDWRRGCVFLLDELDKAEAEVPNGLLEALGAREFTPEGRTSPVRSHTRPPLVVITTNEERTLPDAFLRRCLVLHLKLPSDQQEQRALLILRGRTHFPNLDEGVLAEAADMLFKDRMMAMEKQIRPWPGQAEYLDLLRAVGHIAPGDPEKQSELLETLREYSLQKHVGAEA